MLELQNISFGVSESQGKKEILKDISLTVGENKFVVITGPNGGGKSTLAKMIMGIEKPRSGKILFDGQDITEKTITERANLGISFALQGGPCAGSDPPGGQKGPFCRRRL